MRLHNLTRLALVAAAAVLSVSAFAQDGSFDPPYTGFLTSDVQGLNYGWSLSGSTITLTLDVTGPVTFGIAGDAIPNGTSLTNIFGVFALDSSDKNIGDDFGYNGVGTATGTSSPGLTADQTAINSWNFGIQDLTSPGSTYGLGNGSTNGGTGFDQIKSFVAGDEFKFSFKDTHAPAADFAEIQDVGFVTYYNNKYTFFKPTPTPEPVTICLGVAGLGYAIRRRRNRA